MSADFLFRYYPASEEPYEVEEASSDFYVSLFDVDIQFLQEGDLLTSFVHEYREQTGRIESETEEVNFPTMEEIMEPNLDDMEWGPSTPFAPTEAKLWAQKWTHFIREADENILAAVFPYTMDINTGKSRLQKEYAIEDLQQIIDQAECAQRHDAQLTVEVIWS